MDMNVLIVEKNPTMRETYARYLEDNRPELCIFTAADREEALAICKKKQISCLVTNYFLKSGTAQGLIQSLQSELPEQRIHVLVITTPGNAQEPRVLRHLAWGTLSRDEVSAGNLVSKVMAALKEHKLAHASEPSHRNAAVISQIDAPAQVIAQTRYRGVFFGVNSYADQNIPNLNSPLTDIYGLKNVLEAHYGFEQIPCYENPDGRAIEHAFKELNHGSGENENLLIYFAGHGVVDHLDEGYWLPHDAAYQQVGTYYAYSRLLRYVRRLPMRHILILSDACMSGAIFNNYRDLEPLPQSLQEYHRKKSRWAFTSCDDTPCLDRCELSSKGYSPVIEVLIELLKENTEHGVTAKQLSIKVADSVGNTHRQKPICKPLEGCDDRNGEFVFFNRHR